MIISPKFGPFNGGIEISVSIYSPITSNFFMNAYDGVFFGDSLSVINEYGYTNFNGMKTFKVQLPQRNRRGRRSEPVNVYIGNHTQTFHTENNGFLYVCDEEYKKEKRERENSLEKYKEDFEDRKESFFNDQEECFDDGDNEGIIFNEDRFGSFDCHSLFKFLLKRKNVLEIERFFSKIRKEHDKGHILLRYLLNQRDEMDRTVFDLCDEFDLPRMKEFLRKEEKKKGMENSSSSQKQKKKDSFFYYSAKESEESVFDVHVSKEREEGSNHLEMKKGLNLNFRCHHCQHDVFIPIGYMPIEEKNLHLSEIICEQKCSYCGKMMYSSDFQFVSLYSCQCEYEGYIQKEKSKESQRVNGSIQSEDEQKAKKLLFTESKEDRINFMKLNVFPL